MLSAVRTARDASVGAIVTLLLTILLYVVITVAAMWQFLVVILYVAMSALLGAAHWGIAIWSAAIAPDISLRHAATQMMLAARSTEAVLNVAPHYERLIVTGLLALVIVIIYMSAIKPRVEQIIADCLVNVSGVDLCAAFDPVSHPLTALGELERVQRIAQSHSLTDHILYFTNRKESLRAIEMHLGGLVGKVPRGELPAPESDAALAGEARAMVRASRVFRFAVAFCTVVVVASFWRSTPAIAWIAGLGVLLVGTFVKHAVWRHRQSEPTERTIRRLRRRPVHPWWCAGAAFVTAATMLGAMMRPMSPTGALLAFVAYVALIVTTVCAIARAAWTIWASVAGLLPGAIVWAMQGTTYGAVMALVLVGLSAIFVALYLRRIRGESDQG